MKGNIFLKLMQHAVAKQFHLELDDIFNKDKSVEIWLTPDKCYTIYVWKDRLEFLTYKGLWPNMVVMCFTLQ